MKTGAGEDPFADEEGDGASGSEEADRTERRDPTESGKGDRSETGRADAPGDTDRTRNSRQGGSRTGTPPGRDRSTADRQGEEDADERVRPAELPYIARRNARGDNVKSGRDARRLFELRPRIAEKEEPFLEELTRRLGEEVPKTDAREAALAVVYDRPGLVAEKLEEWGVNYFEKR